MTPDLPRTTMVRARHGSAVVPDAPAPWDRLLYRLFHPARYSGATEERQTGQLPPDASASPWPVVILMNGINVGPEGYRWLAEQLASAGMATLTFSHVTEITPGQVGLSPGLDLDALGAGQYGSRASSTTLGPILEALAREQADGPLAGLLDLQRVVVGGHSAGGTAALLNADPAWFPGVTAAFSYAGHTMPAAILGHSEGTVLPIAADTPALVMGGSADLVVAASAIRYAHDGAAPDHDLHDPVAETFLRATTADGSALAVIEGAGHLTFCDPPDPTTARGFLEPDDGAAGARHRALIGELITAFCRIHLGTTSHAPALDELGASPMVARFEVR